MIDLHIHTLASQDGQYTPREIFEQARACGLRTIAFTDHDSVDSVSEGMRLAEEFGIGFAPAVELTTVREGHEIHLLAYFVDPANAELAELMAHIIRVRVDQAERRCEKLRDYGYAIDYNRVVFHSGGKPPTSHPIFQAIMENPANRGFAPAERYRTGDRSESPTYNFVVDHFWKDGPGYVPLDTIDTREAVRLARKWRTVPVLAHPGRTPMELAEGIIDAGVLGLEAYNSSHTAEQTRACLELARKRGLLVTAGSDYHGPAIKPDIELGKLAGAEDGLYETLKRTNETVKGAK